MFSTCSAGPIIPVCIRVGVAMAGQLGVETIPNDTHLQSFWWVSCYHCRRSWSRYTQITPCLPKKWHAWLACQLVLSTVFHLVVRATLNAYTNSRDCMPLLLYVMDRQLYDLAKQFLEKCDGATYFAKLVLMLKADFGRWKRTAELKMAKGE